MTWKIKKFRMPWKDLHSLTKIISVSMVFELHCTLHCMDSPAGCVSLLWRHLFSMRPLDRLTVGVGNEMFVHPSRDRDMRRWRRRMNACVVAQTWTLDQLWLVCADQEMHQLMTGQGLEYSTRTYGESWRVLWKCWQTVMRCMLFCVLRASVSVYSKVLILADQDLGH